MVSYSESNEGLDKFLADDTCKKIYDDVIKILTDKTISLAGQEEFLMDLLQKYKNHYLVYYYLGYYHTHAKNPDVAISCYKLCINANRKCIDAYLNLAIILHKYGKISETHNVLLAGYQEDPSNLRILNFLGALHYLNKDFYIAYAFYKDIIEQTKEPSESLKNIYNNLGFSCSAIGKCKKAMHYFDMGLASSCTVECTKINTQLLQNKLINYDYMYKLPGNTQNNYNAINTLLNSVPNYAFDKKSNCKLHIGYISGDLRQHVVASFIDSILRHYDRTQFEVYCYANVEHEDNVSARFKNYPEIKWFNIFDVDTETTCNLIKSHQIDILIDLSGHTNNNRLDVMAKKPAPIQMTYLGYPNTTGLTTIDYRITDKYADPETTTQWFSEKLIRMPKCFVCFTPSIDLSTIPINISDLTIKKNIVFGVLNKNHKYNKHTYRVWNRVINAVPNSKLIIKKDIRTSKNESEKCLSMLNLPSSKCDMIDYVGDQQKYLLMYNDIDICLDTFPYSGTTTTCDALLMGTPVVTLNIPNRHVSNVTCSFMINMGFPELIAHSMEEYIDIAVKLANDPAKIAYYKQNIRTKFLELMNAQSFTKEFDQLLLSTYNSHIVPDDKIIEKLD